MRRVILATLIAVACTARSEGARGDRELDSAASAPDTTSAATLPAPVDSSIGWSRMVGLVRQAPDSIRAVHQVHTRDVTVLFKDGRRYHATEPAIDDVIKLLKEVDPAGRILIATE